ncbi:PAS/PAC sensor signal transduction histidine kinase [Desulfofarcimen acetoxidans DSM 771]|uniref:histidine kinase n=2 Tax=Desulfofarcimen acetoxidans TaxID=58138 RepID=C8W391_DESAS|nr:PAS/PAC sensor signal transduction histidine kinase [Desulfofarcimen acetoxidans DSM 771]
MLMKKKYITLKYEGFTNQLLILVVILLLIPIILSMYLFYMLHSTELGIINSHRKVLEEAMNQLDSSMNSSFDEILSGLNVGNLQRRDQEKALNQALKPVVDNVKKKYPNMDMGFYSEEFDVILDGDNEHLHENFSTRRKRNFDDALKTNNMVFEVLGQGGDGQLETYRPLRRDGKIIGAIWANEDIKPIQKRVDQIQQVVYVVMILGVVLAFGGAFSLISKFAKNVNEIKKGLNIMGNDPTFMLPKATGELGQITDAVNDMFNKLIDIQNYNELILTSIDDGIITIDKNEKIMSFNSTAGAMLDLDSNCIEKKIDEVFPPDFPLSYYLKNTLIEGKAVKDKDLIFENFTDGPRHLLVSTSLMINVRQELVGALLHFRDITELSRLRESVNRQKRLASLGKLVAGVAHEIRSPLTSITGYMQFWNKGRVPSSKSLNIVNQELNRLISVTDKLLQFARPSRAVFEPYELNILIRRAVQFFRDIHGSSDVKISCNCAENLPLAWIDAHQMEQVLSNILYNAYQAINRTGNLEITTWLEKERNMLCVGVRDNGCGIPKDVIQNMFEPFYTTKSKGTGLGLSIAKEIISAHNGEIQVESELNVGTMVVIYLPMFIGDDMNVKSVDSR